MRSYTVTQAARRRIALLLLLGILIGATSGCGAARGEPRALLSAFCAGMGDALPAGQIYTSGRDKWENEALPAGMEEVLFREDNGENAFSLCSSYAIFLSSSYLGGEVCFLRCDSGGNAAAVAEMCAARIRRVRRVAPEAAILRDACVLRYGCDVVLLMLPDNQAARAVCDRVF